MQLIQNGQDFVLGNFGSLPEKLPLGTYSLLFNDMTKSYYLHLIDNVELPNKIYGDLEDFSRRVCIKYENTTRNLGVLLTGVKGAGKSLTAKIIAKLLYLPVIIISDGYDDSNFISFLTDPSLGSCVILIDEFDKLYDRDNADSNKLLSLLDGPYNTHHVYIFTTNEFYRVNSMMKNRPSRIHFLKEFTGLDEYTVKDIGNDILDNKEWIPELIDISQKMTECTFDTIMSICADSNLYKESPKTVVKYMNVLIESSQFELFEEENGTLIYCGDLKLKEDGKWNNGQWVRSNTKKDEDGDDVDFYFQPDLFTPTSVNKDERVYNILEHGLKLILRRRKTSFINYVF